MTTPADRFDQILRDAFNRGAFDPDSRAAQSERFDVVKVAAVMPVSDELLMDAGVIPDTRPPVRIPWHRRARWRWQEWRERVGRKVGGWIAGVDLSERDDW